jgi:hypothetical protein
MISPLKKRFYQVLSVVIFLNIAIISASAEEIKLPREAKVYEHSSPAFTISYPANYNIKEVDGVDFIFMAAAPNQYDFPTLLVRTSSIEVNSSKEAIKNLMIKREKEEWADTHPKDFKLLSQKDVTLTDSTPAIATKIVYKGDFGPTHLYQISVIKNGKAYDIMFAWSRPKTNAMTNFAHTIAFE